MFASDAYELIDFGDGRRLERFAGVVLDRTCPAAERFRPSERTRWEQADARFDGRDQERGEWMLRRELPERWLVSFGPLQFELKRTEFGHLGLFPEQNDNWSWIAEQCRLAKSAENRTIKVLNLFAYTGGSTLAAAAANAEVVHVDSAKNIVAWARRNAQLSGLGEMPIRWIVEDAVKFVKREAKRGNRYDALILDPPSYGHGAHGEVWRLSKHLPRLLDLCAELTDGRPRFMLLTCHTPGYGHDLLEDMIREHFNHANADPIEAGPILLRAADGRSLPSGVAVRLASTPSNPPNGQ